MATIIPVKNLLDMVSEVRDLANMPTLDAETIPVTSATGDTRFSQTRRIVRALNRALQQLYNKLQIARGQGRFSVTHDATMVASQTDYALPSDFIELESAWWYDGSSDYLPMEVWQNAEEPYLRTVSATIGEVNRYVAPYSYRLFPAAISILPVPTSVTSGELIRLRYVPRFQALSSSRQEAPWAAGWEDWAIYRAAMEMLGIEENDTASSIVQSWSILDSQIGALASSRNAALPPTTNDVSRW